MCPCSVGNRVNHLINQSTCSLERRSSRPIGSPPLSNREQIYCMYQYSLSLISCEPTSAARQSAVAHSRSELIQCSVGDFVGNQILTQVTAPAEQWSQQQHPHRLSVGGK